MHFVCKTNWTFGQAIFYKIEGMPLEESTMGEIRLVKPFGWNGGNQVWVGKKAWNGAKENS
jgi:hypothetical protein